jgi:uncharacterized protein YjbI with pentapeptide repeats
MKLQLASCAALLCLPLWTPPVVLAEDLEHVQQLLSTRTCSNCDLTNAGLVLANLAKVDLRGADLSNANLSRANLSQADLTGANLTGATLFGANLAGAKLNSANLSNTDLRSSYLTNAEVAGINLSNANLQGVIGLPSQVGSAKDFFNWAITASDQGKYGPAIENYTQAVTLDSNLAAAYLGRGVAQYRIGNKTEALADSTRAAELYLAQRDEQGHQAASSFITLLQTMPQESKTTASNNRNSNNNAGLSGSEPTPRGGGGGGGFGRAMTSILSTGLGLFQMFSGFAI